MKEILMDISFVQITDATVTPQYKQFGIDTIDLMSNLTEKQTTATSRESQTLFAKGLTW